MSSDPKLVNATLVLANAVDLTLRILRQVNANIAPAADREGSLNTSTFVQQRLVNNLLQKDK